MSFPPVFCNRTRNVGTVTTEALLQLLFFTSERTVYILGNWQRYFVP